MRSFRESTRVFWTGWAYIFDYLAAFKEQAVEVLWGAGMIGIPFALVSLVWKPSWWHAFGYVLAAVVFVAGYQLWRDLHLRLRPGLTVTKVVPQKRPSFYPNTPPPPNKRTGEAVEYYFEVAGTSEASTIQDVRVQLEKISPPIPNLDWIPVALFQKHDNVPHAQSFDLHPGAVKHIDLIFAQRGGDDFEIRHIVHGIVRDIPINGHRLLTVSITAKDTPKISVLFDVWKDEDGFFQCNMVQKAER